ncbi:protein SHORT HYPOCOTYL IN WHITE LIGHT 1, partial [Humulus lupulus]|uniref:protein SHORT HYPOCOTYL IN WHITE LIGHT 1 n=1 Tax=Humulus lupulus TaxID=3486 RepID=UPI002B40CC11
KKIGTKTRKLKFGQFIIATSHNWLCSVPLFGANLHPPKFQIAVPCGGVGFHRQAQGSDNLVDDPRIWSRSINSEFGRHGHDEDDDEGDEDEEEDRSLDLLIKFVQNVFKKISKRARRAVRSVLPIVIPTKLVGFSVNGVLILAFLWILKAFLEVVCTIGSVVFVSILLIRGIWTGVIYLQENHNLSIKDFDDENGTWNRVKPA